MRYRKRAEACRAAESAPPSGIMTGEAITGAPPWRGTALLPLPLPLPRVCSQEPSDN